MIILFQAKTALYGIGYIIYTMGCMHSDAQFAGSSSVPAHVEMMGFLGIGNKPMAGYSVACTVDVAQVFLFFYRLKFFFIRI